MALCDSKNRLFGIPKELQRQRLLTLVLPLKQYFH